MRTEGIGNLKTSKDPTGNRTDNLPSCGAVRQPTAPIAPISILFCLILFLHAVALLLDAPSMDILCSIFRKIMISLNCLMA
jgi:hypothetical protein